MAALVPEGIREPRPGIWVPMSMRGGCPWPGIWKMVAGVLDVVPVGKANGIMNPGVYMVADVVAEVGGGQGMLILIRVGGPATMTVGSRAPIESPISYGLAVGGWGGGGVARVGGRLDAGTL